MAGDIPIKEIESNYIFVYPQSNRIGFYMLLDYGQDKQRYKQKVVYVNDDQEEIYYFTSEAEILNYLDDLGYELIESNSVNADYNRYRYLMRKRSVN